MPTRVMARGFLQHASCIVCCTSGTSAKRAVPVLSREPLCFIMLHHVMLLRSLRGLVLWWTNCPRAARLKILVCPDVSRISRRTEVPTNPLCLFVLRGALHSPENGGQGVHERHASGFWYVPMFHEFLAPGTEVPTRAIARGFLGYTNILV